MSEHTRQINRVYAWRFPMSTDETGLVLASEPLASFYGAGTVLVNDLWSASLNISATVHKDVGGSYGIIAKAYSIRVHLLAAPAGSTEQYILLKEPVVELGSEAGGEDDLMSDNFDVQISGGALQVVADVHGVGRGLVIVTGHICGGPLP